MGRQFRLRRYLKHSRQCLATFPNTSNLVNTLLCASYFQLSFPCLIYYLNMSPCIWSPLNEDKNTVCMFQLKRACSFTCNDTKRFLPGVTNNSLFGFRVAQCKQYFTLRKLIRSCLLGKKNVNIAPFILSFYSSPSSR